MTRDHTAPPVTLGVKEEFFLADPGLFALCQRHSGPHRIVRELLRSQVETNTRVCRSLNGVDAALEHWHVFRRRLQGIRVCAII